MNTSATEIVAERIKEPLRLPERLRLVARCVRDAVRQGHLRPEDAPAAIENLMVGHLEDLYQTLVTHCGAPDDDHIREQLIEALVRSAEDDAIEFRFGGQLGAGGKLRIHGNEIYVDCYPEDLDPRRQAMIDRVNQALKEL